MWAWDSDLIEHHGRGIYRAAKSKAGEQFFWEGPRAASPRMFTLWMEPVITVGGLARLHFDFDWPKESIGCQSQDWAFDLVAILPNQTNEYIACEVKKASREIDYLADAMQAFGRDPIAIEPRVPGKLRNAFKKVGALRSRKIPLFWALGPNGDSRVFRVSYNDNGAVTFSPAFPEALSFPRGPQTSAMLS